MSDESKPVLELNLAQPSSIWELCSDRTPSKDSLIKGVTPIT